MKTMISNLEYHANEAIGSSILKKISSSTVQHAILQPFKQSDAMILGSAFHAALLEPETFKQDYIVDDIEKEGLFVTSDDIKAELKRLGLKVSGKKAELVGRLIEVDESYEDRIHDLLVEKFNIMAEGRTILTKEQGDKIPLMVKAVLNHKIAGSMLIGAETEYSYIARDKETGRNKKCRPDIYNKGSLIDLKVARDASETGFIKACIDYGYILQSPYYLDVFNESEGTDIKDFYFIVVEPIFPHAVNVFRMGDVENDIGRQLYKKAFLELDKYLKDTPDNLASYGYPIRINEIQLPIWALQKASDKIDGGA